MRRLRPKFHRRVLWVPAIAVLACLPVFSETIRKTAEQISPYGYYDKLGIQNSLTVGVPATAAGVPANAAQGNASIRSDVLLQAGTMTVDEEMRIGKSIGGFFEPGLGFRVLRNASGEYRVSMGVGAEKSAELNINGTVWSSEYLVKPRSDLLPVPENNIEVSAVTLASLQGKPRIRAIDYPNTVIPLWIKGSPYIVLNARPAAVGPLGIASNGRVGISLGNVDTVPAVGNEVQVGSAAFIRNIRANSFLVPSARSLKTDIYQLGVADYADILNKLSELELYHFRYRGDESGTLRTGLILEEAPEILKASDGRTVSTYDQIGFLIASAKALARENARLESKLSALETEMTHAD